MLLVFLGVYFKKLTGGFDWNQVGDILSFLEGVTKEIEFKKRASSYDLLLDRAHGLIRGKSHLKGQNILSHPFFSEKYKEQLESRELFYQ